MTENDKNLETELRRVEIISSTILGQDERWHTWADMIHYMLKLGEKKS